MFDIAFSELIVVGIVALIVIGPDKLPKVARTAGHLFGRAQKYVSDVKSDINRELRFEELQKLQDEIRQNAPNAESSPYQVGQIIKHDMPQVESPKDQEGQVIKHDIAQNDNSSQQQPLPELITEAPEPLPLKQASQN